jgi:hypothetical protein
MYNTKFVCTYNTPEVFSDDDNVDENEKDFIRNTIYRQELLDILNIDDFNEDEMNKTIHDLYIILKDCNELKECMSRLAGHFMSTDQELGLMIMFSYDYMYQSHICISEFLETGKIEDKNIWKMKSIIF